MDAGEQKRVFDDSTLKGKYSISNNADLKEEVYMAFLPQDKRRIQTKQIGAVKAKIIELA